MPTKSKSLRIALLAASIAICSGAGEASAETWPQSHPRRAEVNQRLANQNSRFNREVRQGKIARAQARSMHQQDRSLRREERNMASQNNGRITGAEQRTLNQQENGISREIGK